MTVERLNLWVQTLAAVAAVAAAIIALAISAKDRQSARVIAAEDRRAALELARHGIRVNSIHPGMIETDMMTDVTGGNAERHDKFANSVPMRRPAEPTEVAALALFLASSDSSYCTGSEFVVDGGMTAS